MRITDSLLKPIFCLLIHKTHDLSIVNLISSICQEKSTLSFESICYALLYIEALKVIPGK